MITSVDTVKRVKSNKDHQRNDVYRFDSIIVNYLKNNDIDYSKLYEGLSENANVLELSYKVADDFNLSLDNRHDLFSFTNSTYSYCQYHRVFYSQNNISNKIYMIETMFHEIAHLFNVVQLGKSQSGHDGGFLFLLRMFFDFYNIIDAATFNALLEKFGKVIIYDNYLEIKELNDQEFKLAKSTTEEVLAKRNNYFIVDEDKKELFYTKNEKNGKCILYSRNKYGYEYKNNVFDNMDFLELKNVIIISPVMKISYNGYRTTSKYDYDNGFLYHTISCDYEYSNGFNSFIIDKNYSVFDDIETAKKEVSSFSKDHKKNNYDVFRTYTFEEYSLLVEEFEKSFKEKETLEKERYSTEIEEEKEFQKLVDISLDNQLNLILN